MNRLKSSIGIAFGLLSSCLFLGIACGIGDSHPTDEGLSDIEYYFSQQGIQELKARFAYDSASEWYTHQQWADTLIPHSGLRATVNRNGYYVLSSVYVGEAPIVHTHIRVKIGTKTFSSASIALTHSTHQETYMGSQLVEITQYPEYQDNHILENIAASGQEPLHLDLLSRTQQLTFPISDADRQALIDCFQLSVLNRLSSQ